MKTLIDRRRSQPFREFLDSPSWLKEEPKKVPLTRGQNVAKQIFQTVGHVIFWAALTFLFVRSMFSL